MRVAVKKYRVLLIAINTLTFGTGALGLEDAFSRAWDTIDSNHNEILMLNLQSVFKDGFNVHGTVRLEKLEIPFVPSNSPGVITADIVTDCINSKMKIENIVSYVDNQMTQTVSQANKDEIRKKINDNYKDEIMMRLCEEEK